MLLLYLITAGSAVKLQPSAQNSIAVPLQSSLLQSAPITAPLANVWAQQTLLAQNVAQDEDDVESVASMAQMSSVSQLADVRPTDWAFQALQSLVERYGCMAGYPDRTFRGNRALSRYEFAAGLNACLDRISELIAAGTADLVKQADLAALQRLQEEFAAELATLRGRVRALEARAATLERQQFATTTKLNGETVFGIVSVLGGDRADGDGADRIPTFSYRVRLNLETSFTGRDLLTTRLQANNVHRWVVRLPLVLGQAHSAPTKVALSLMAIVEVRWALACCAIGF